MNIIYLLIGNVLGSALYWKNEYEKIYMDATHDGLSGLLNHQTFKDRFRDEVKRAERFQQKMAIMIFDLDKFKKVNDTLGHQYGDYVIQTVAKIMLDNVRAVDVVARYGGEEFAIILINTTAAMSNVVAKRIVSNIADYNFSMDDIETRITISGGMSEYPTHTKKMKELIEYADQAMYETKQNGGNNITIHNIFEVRLAKLLKIIIFLILLCPLMWLKGSEFEDSEIALHHFMQGEFLMNQGNYSLAILEFQDAIDLDP